MNYKIQSLLTVGMVLTLMIVIGVYIGQMDTAITGAVVAPVCECVENSDCNDFNSATEDICVNQENCQEAYCLNK